MNMNMLKANKTIDKILNTPIKNPTKEEAKEVLKNCGIFDENYNLTEAYKDIFISKKEYNPITKHFVVHDYDAYLKLLQEIEKGDAE